MDVQKDEQLKAFISKACKAWLEEHRSSEEGWYEIANSAIMDTEVDLADIKEAFKAGAEAREQYLLDTYFKEPKGKKLVAPNMNEGGFVGLETRILAEINFRKFLFSQWTKNPNIGILKKKK